MAGELIIVSGGSSGLGAALIDRCPRSGDIYDLSRTGSRAAIHVPVDLSTIRGMDEAADFFDRVVSAFDGDRATFIHNAGTLTPIGFAGDVDPDAYRANVLLNSAAPQIIGGAFLAAATTTDARCDLAMIGSGAATTPYAGWSSYGAAKAGLAQWVRTVGLEQTERGSSTRVVWIAPGVIATEMQKQIRESPARDFPEVARFQELLDTGRLSTPGEAADAIWAVLDGDFENGATLDVRDL